ncbi:MAG: PIN domain nuclease, partial [Candidatus Levyibacteriota bacterium]
LDDGTMIVVEEGSTALNKELDVVVSRIIQTATGRILFAKRI